MAIDLTPAVYTVFSRGAVRIPASALLVGGMLSVDPAVHGKGYFSVHFRGAELEIVAGGFCGFVPLNERCAVDIRPKMPVESVNRIFDVASLAFRSISGRSRPYDIGLDGSGPVLEFLAAELASALRVVIAAGLRKLYERRGRSDDKPHGKIDFGRTLRDNIARGKGYLISTSSFEHVVDIPVNRVIRAAGELIIRKLRVQRIVNRDLIAELGTTLSYFSGVGRMSATDLRAFLAADAATVSESRPGYALALNVAVLILRDQSAVVENVGSDIDLTAVVVDFEKLFEEYLRNVLRLEQQRQDRPLSVLNGNREGKKALFDGRSTPTAEPDIVIRAAGGDTVLLVEVKYKSAPDRSDINQAVTYAVSYRVDQIIIAYQAIQRADAGLREIGHIGQVHVFGYGILLDSSDLGKQEAAFADAVFGLARARATERPAVV